MRAPATAARREPASRPSDSLSSSRRRVAHNQNAKTQQRNPRPAQGTDIFTKKKMPQQRHDHVGQRRSRLHETEIRPGENQSVGNKKREQENHAQPNRSGSKRAREKMKQRRGVLHVQSAHFFHAVSQKHVTQRAK